MQNNSYYSSWCRSRWKQLALVLSLIEHRNGNPSRTGWNYVISKMTSYWSYTLMITDESALSLMLVISRSAPSAMVSDGLAPPTGAVHTPPERSEDVAVADWKAESGILDESASKFSSVPLGQWSSVSPGRRLKVRQHVMKIRTSK